MLQVAKAHQERHKIFDVRLVAGDGNNWLGVMSFSTSGKTIRGSTYEYLAQRKSVVSQQTQTHHVTHKSSTIHQA
jgi:hypothetical protein